MKTENWYVTTTDKFMSGWGHAKNLTNKLIFVCDTLKEAQIVADNAEHRTDQKHVNICGSPPSYLRKTFGSDYNVGNYFVQIKTKEDYPSWYKENYFNKSYK